MQRTSRTTRSALLRIAGLIILLIGASIIGYKLGWFDFRHTLEHLTRIRRAHSVGAFVIGFVLIFAVAASIGLPALPFVVASGVLFGTVLASALSWFSAMLAAAIGYWMARSVAHGVVLRWIKRYDRASVAVAQSRDFGGMLRLRLLPVLPLGVVNLIGGLAVAPFVTYMAATAVGVLPSFVIYAYFADSLIHQSVNARSTALISLIVSSVLLILLSLAPRFLKRARNGHQSEQHDSGKSATSSRFGRVG